MAYLGACKSKSNWAKVNQVELSQEDAQILMKHLGFDYNKTSDRKNFVQAWINRQIFIQELSKSNPNQSKIITLSSNWNQGELAKYYIEDAAIKQEIDSLVTDSLVLAYYHQHKEDFALKDYLVRALYLKIPKEAPKQDKLKEHFKLTRDRDFSKVIKYAKLYAVNFYYNDSSWIYFNELAKDAPKSKFNKDNLVLNRTKTYFSDERYVYYLNIIDFKLKNEVPPVEFLRPIIKQLLLSQELKKYNQKNSDNILQQIKKNYEITRKY